MKKTYYLATCDTCKRILKTLDLPVEVELQDIKTDSVSAAQLEEMKEMAGSYAALLNTRSKLYRERDLKEKNLTEEECKSLILEHYTFLKRPVFIIEDELFAGNSKKTMAAIKEKLQD